MSSMDYFGAIGGGLKSRASRVQVPNEHVIRRSLESRKVDTGEGEAESAARFVAIRERPLCATIPKGAG
jgi:hypothetical protein